GVPTGDRLSGTVLNEVEQPRRSRTDEALEVVSPEQVRVRCVALDDLVQSRSSNSPFEVGEVDTRRLLPDAPVRLCSQPRLFGRALRARARAVPQWPVELTLLAVSSWDDVVDVCRLIRGRRQRDGGPCPQIEAAEGHQSGHEPLVCGAEPRLRGEETARGEDR